MGGKTEHRSVNPCSAFFSACTILTSHSWECRYSCLSQPPEQQKYPCQSPKGRAGGPQATAWATSKVCASLLFVSGVTVSCQCCL